MPSRSGAEAHLLDRLLTGRVEARRARVGEPPQHLEQQRRLADAGLAAEQRDRAGHEAAAEHAVELGDAGGDRVPLVEVDVGDADRHAGRRAGGGVARRQHRIELLDERVPRGAAGAAPDPLGRVGAALDATVDRAGAGHDDDRTQGVGQCRVCATLLLDSRGGVHG